MKYPITLFCLFFIFAANAQKKCTGCACFVNKSRPWTVEVDGYGKEYLIKGESLKQANNLGINKLVTTFNATKQLQIELVKTESNTVYVKIADTAALQKMGLASASWYLATLVFTLTENKLYTRVHIDFVEGDHTGPPGFFTRETFSKNYIVCE